ncbi:hypothetical protein E4U23_008023 [Claviceps purpurea]|nr:hypothetical protein E4U23_008023 [Claviceps purpurea]
MKVQTVLLLAGAAAVQGIQPRIVLPAVEILRPHVNASQLQGVKVETVQGRKNDGDKRFKFPPAAEEAVEKTSSFTSPTTTQLFGNEDVIPFQGLPFPSVDPIVVKDQEVPESPEIPGQEPAPTPPPEEETPAHTYVHATTSVEGSAHAVPTPPEEETPAYTSVHATTSVEGSAHSHTTHSPHTHTPHPPHTHPHPSPAPHTPTETYSHEHHTLTFAARSPQMTTPMTPAEEPRPELEEEDMDELEEEDVGELEEDKVTTKHAKTPKTPKATSTAKHTKSKYPKGSKPAKKYPLDPSEPREPNEGDRDVHEEQQGQKDKKAKRLPSPP